MRSVSDPEFLSWAAEAGLMPDPWYPQSRQQLVFVNCLDAWGRWDAPRAPTELTTFVDTVLRLVGEWPFRIRLRGGGTLGFTAAEMELERGSERALRAAALAAGIPAGTRGALEFDTTERSALVDIAVAFLSFGFCVGTDLEIVASDRGSCLMLGHHEELVAHFASGDRLSAFDGAMTAAGYGAQKEERLTMQDDIVGLFAFDRWANRKVLDACRKLTAEQYVAEPAPGWSSVRSTVYHIALVTEYHLRTQAGDPDDSLPTETDLATVDDAARLLERAYRRFDELQPALTPEWLNTDFTQRWPGGSATLPRWSILRHIVNHSSYHRGQVASKLKRFGVEQPITDFLWWVMEQVPKEK